MHQGNQSGTEFLSVSSCERKHGFSSCCFNNHKTNGEQNERKKHPIPDDVLIPACNFTMDFFELQKGFRQCCDKWGEAEKCKCREMCGDDYRYVETDWIGSRAVSLRKAGKLNSVSKKKRKKWEPPSGAYKEYLESEHWQRFRQRVLQFWRYKCCLCPSTKKLDVHHNNYDRLGREEIYDCVAICHACHKRVHGQMKGFPERCEATRS